MKKPFLVTYDYGKGGLWAFVIAESAREIGHRFPELRVVEVEPDWMNDELRKGLKERMTFDIDDSEAWFFLGRCREAARVVRAADA